MTALYNKKMIYDLLVNGFNDSELRRLCQYEQAFRPVYNELSRLTGKTAIASSIVDFADRNRLFWDLLNWASDNNRNRFGRIDNYFDYASFRKLLISLTDADLKEILHSTEFRDVKNSIPYNAGKSDMASHLIDYASSRLNIDRLEQMVYDILGRSSSSNNSRSEKEFIRLSSNQLKIVEKMFGEGVVYKIDTKSMTVEIYQED